VTYQLRHRGQLTCKPGASGAEGLALGDGRTSSNGPIGVRNETGLRGFGAELRQLVAVGCTSYRTDVTC
jgi:hypothetical protein